MEFVEVIPSRPKLGDITTVRFRLLDARGVPLAGAPVKFSLQSDNSSVTLSPAQSDSLVSSGYAETQLVASGRVSSVIVVATVGEKSVQTPPITFAGTVPSGRQLTFQCGDLGAPGSGGRHAITGYDRSRHLLAGSTVDCTAHVGDRNGDGIENALVSFLTEAGTIGPSAVSVSDLVGNATVAYKTSLPLPVDVAPVTFSWSPNRSANYTGEFVAPLWMHPFNWQENPTVGPPGGIYSMEEPRRPDPIRRNQAGAPLQNNRRDNLVTMIAFTSGEEGFTDVNNNGEWDPEEPFDDLTEPFVDSNDDGTWQEDEIFIDVNGDGQWNGKNDKWDANTLIWTAERILWTGMPADEDMMTVVPGVPDHRRTVTDPKCVVPGDCPGGENNFATLTANGRVASGLASRGPVEMVLYMADPWFNPMARNSDSDTCQSDTERSKVVNVFSPTHTGLAFTYPSHEYALITIEDRRDPLTEDAPKPPFQSPPINFIVDVTCSFTSSPKDGFPMKFRLATVRGSIE